MKISQARLQLANVRPKRRAKLSNLFLREIGMVARPVVYLAPMVVMAWWLWPYLELVSQSLHRLAPIDFFLIGGCVVGFFGVTIPTLLIVFNVDGSEIDWEAWGCVGCGLFAALLPLWATFWAKLY